MPPTAGIHGGDPIDAAEHDPARAPIWSGEQWSTPGDATPPQLPRMAVKRIKLNIRSDRFDESRAFHNGVIGLHEGSGPDWIRFFGTDQREVQLSVMRLDLKAGVHPDVSI